MVIETRVQALGVVNISDDPSRNKISSNCRIAKKPTIDVSF